MWPRETNVSCRKRSLNLIFRELTYCLSEHFPALSFCEAKNLEKKGGTTDREQGAFA
jgi:hypothetical protein